MRQLKRKPYARVVAGLVAEAQTDPEFGELYREHFVRPRRDATRELLVQGPNRGEIAETRTSSSPSISCTARSTTACCTDTPP